MSFEQEQNAIATGKWAFSATYNNSLEAEIFKVEKGAELPYDIQPMTAPADPDGNRYLPIAYQHDGLPSWGIVCSSKVEHPELLAAYMDQVVSPFGRDIFNYGVEGTTFDYVDGVPTIRDGIDKAEYGHWHTVRSMDGGHGTGWSALPMATSSVRQHWTTT